MGIGSQGSFPPPTLGSRPSLERTLWLGQGEAAALLGKSAPQPVAWRACAISGHPGAPLQLVASECHCSVTLGLEDY